MHYTYILGHSYNSRSSISIFAEFVNRNNEINDIQKNVKYDLTNNYFIFKTNYDFAIISNLKNQLVISNGPYFSYLLNSNITSESDIEFPENEFQNFEMGLGFGLNYTRNFGKYNLSIGYNFMLGLTDAFEERDFRYNSHNINLIYTFIIK